MINSFEKNIQNLYGEAGKAWLLEIPSILAKVSRAWNLDNLKPYKNLSYNYVLSGFQKNRPVILKLNPKPENLQKEANALKAFTGYGVTSILAEMDGALLIEKAQPGHSLKTYFPHRDDKAIQIVCTAIQKLHQAPMPNNAIFPSISNWLSGLDKNWDIPNQYLNKARTLKNQLLETMVTPVLLHGDLHHDNILANNNGWLIIDPKGVIGESAYEIAAFIRNPIPELLSLPNAKAIITHRIKTFSQLLKLDEQHILQWCFVQAVLCQIWALEDNNTEQLSYFKRLTEIFYEYVNNKRFL